jgi:hypothetical protein
LTSKRLSGELCTVLIVLSCLPVKPAAVSGPLAQEEMP